MRWQCQRFDGTWDETQFNEDRRHYLRNVRIIDLAIPELRQFLVEYATARLAGETLSLENFYETPRQNQKGAHRAAA